MNESYFNLFSFCKVVKGQNRAIICDFQKENIEFIPLEMAEVIAELKENSIEKLEKNIVMI